MNLIRKHFPKHHRYHKIFNKNTIKLSYSCMPNIGSIISRNNTKLLTKSNVENNRTCNCRNKVNCPLNGNCLVKCIVYKATVITNNIIKYYLGTSEGEFKERYNNHTKSFRNKGYKTETELSKYLWNLKDKNQEYELTWCIAAKASPYMCGTRLCDLCLKEKLLILQADPSSLLNKRSELVSKYRHKNKFLLKNFK